MDAKEFLERVLSDNGVYCVLAIKNGKINQTKFLDSLDEVVAAATQFDAEGKDAFFGLSTFEFSEGQDASRAAVNAKYLRSFFLDIDCGATKDYETKHNAVAALKKFCKAYNLPKPTMVDSGRGLHIYWMLEQAISRDTWKPVADRLKELCLESGLHIDTSVTADPARVLRIPGTHNYKGDTPLPVTIIGEPQQAVTFELFKSFLGESLFKPTRRQEEPDALTQAISGNYESRFKVIMMKTITGEGCAQLKEIVTNQNGISEPLWRAGLSIAAYCADKSKSIHRISEKHEGYSYDDTEKKVSGIKGPYRCTRFDEINPGVCKDCKYYGKIASPITLGSGLKEVSQEETVVQDKMAGIPSAPVQQYVIPKYPSPYKKAAGGGVIKEVKDKEGEAHDVLIYHNPLYVVGRIYDKSYGGESVVMRLHLPKDGVREFTVPVSATTSKEELRKHLSEKGVAVQKWEEIMHYTTRWVNELQQTEEASNTHRQFGWTNPQLSSFIVGGLEITSAAFKLNPPANNTVSLFEALEPKGTLEVWKETVNFYNRPGFEDHQFMFATGFGSVLMELTPLHCAIFHMHSPESGVGKTTSMIAGASVWGNPEVLILDKKDTINSMMNRVEIYKNLPAFFDELTNSDPEGLSNFVYGSTSGTQRNRLSIKGNVERVRGMPWKNLWGTTGNTSLLERIGLYKAVPQAEQQRVLEHRVAKINLNKEDTDKFSTALTQNYGHAGPIFVQYVMQNRDAVIKLHIDVRSKIDKAAGLDADNRFWSAAASTRITAMVIAKKLGLIDYDINALTKWAVNKLKQAKEACNSSGSTYTNLLTDYLSYNYNNVLRINSTADGRLADNTVTNTIANDMVRIMPDGTPRMSLVARYEPDTQKLYLLPKPLKAWCGKQQVNYAGFIESLEKGITKMIRGKVRLGKGTSVNLPPADVLILDCSGFWNAETEEIISSQTKA